MKYYDTEGRASKRHLKGQKETSNGVDNRSVFKNLLAVQSFKDVFLSVVPRISIDLHD